MDAITRLAVDARDGDELALEAFIRRTQADVWRLAAHLVDRASADDVTQEVFLRAVPALSRYRADAPARIWLLSIARRTCVDVLRRRDRDRRLRRRLEEQRGAGEHVVPEGSPMVDLDVLLADLDPDRRSAFVLTQMLGLPYQEAANICGVPIGTIRSRVARARGDLAEVHDADRELGSADG